MLMPEQVPDEVAKAVMHCFHTRNAAKSAIAAAINAWPGMWHIKAVDFEGKVILPLPMEQAVKAKEARDE